MTTATPSTGIPNGVSYGEPLCKYVSVLHAVIDAGIALVTGKPVASLDTIINDANRHLDSSMYDPSELARQIAVYNIGLLSRVRDGEHLTAVYKDIVYGTKDVPKMVTTIPTSVPLPHTPPLNASTLLKIYVDRPVDGREILARVYVESIAASKPASLEKRRQLSDRAITGYIARECFDAEQIEQYMAFEMCAADIDAVMSTLGRQHMHLLYIAAFVTLGRMSSTHRIVYTPMYATHRTDTAFIRIWATVDTIGLMCKQTSVSTPAGNVLELLSFAETLCT